MSETAAPHLILKSSKQWFFDGVKQLATIPALILILSFVGFGGLTAEAGLSVEQAMLLALSTWALPSAVVVVGAILNEVPFYATVIAVLLASIRLMPMTIALMPVLRTEKTTFWHLLLVSNFVAVTAWVFAMKNLPHMPRPGRLPFFFGFGLSLAIVNTLTVGVSHTLVPNVPPVVAAVLIFLTPIYFLVSMTEAAKLRADYLAIGFGLVLGPVFHLIAPETDLLWCGLLGGTCAYGLGRLMARRREAS